MVFSEFGRRVKQNGSAGTDHGTAAPVFLVGPVAKPGVFGNHPSLVDLDQGDLKYGIDFRSVYTSVLEDWMKAPAAKILRGEFASLTVSGDFAPKAETAPPVVGAVSEIWQTTGSRPSSTHRVEAGSRQPSDACRAGRFPSTHSCSFTCVNENRPAEPSRKTNFFHPLPGLRAAEPKSAEAAPGGGRFRNRKHALQ